jgi:succinate dehydrogenase/fumarate reductase flavoprotein subunit
MTRRGFLTGAVSAAALGATASLIGCAPKTPDTPGQTDSQGGNTDSGQTTQTEQGYYASEEFTYFEPTKGEIAFVANPIPDSDIKETWECDLLVIGAGIAGLSAAASAAENGLKTLLIEKGSNIAVHGNEIGGIGSAFIKESGLEVSHDIILNEALLAANYRCSTAVWKRYLDFSGSAIDWLDETVLAGSAGNHFLGSAADRIENGVNWRAGVIGWESGMQGVNEGIRDYALAQGAEIRFSTPGVQLVQESDGSISGAIAKDGSTYVRINATKGVCLATGSYEYNWERMKKCLRPRDIMVSAWLNTSFTDTGDGHEMGRAVGGVEDEYPQVTMNDSSGSPSHGAYSAAIMPLMRVNENGERFVNEALTLNYIANMIGYQKGAHDWIIVDGNLDDVVKQMQGDAPFDASMMKESFLADCISADTLEELADKCGINKENLLKTVERYNQLAESGVDADFHKSAVNLIVIKEPPFYAFDEGLATLVTVSGLKINPYSQVLKSDETPVEGLYALGNCSGSMFSDTYPHHLAGVSHGRCVTFGWLLGRRLAGIEE